MEEKQQRCPHDGGKCPHGYDSDAPQLCYPPEAFERAFKDAPKKPNAMLELGTVIHGLIKRGVSQAEIDTHGVGWCVNNEASSRHGALMFAREELVHLHAERDAIEEALVEEGLEEHEIEGLADAVRALASRLRRDRETQNEPPASRVLVGMRRKLEAQRREIVRLNRLYQSQKSENKIQALHLKDAQMNSVRWETQLGDYQGQLKLVRQQRDDAVKDIMRACEAASSTVGPTNSATEAVRQLQTRLDKVPRGEGAPDI